MKMKIMIFLVLSFGWLFADQIHMEGGDATLLINGQEFNVPKDRNLTVNPGTMVCFVKGTGKAIINDKIELSSKKPGCYQIPPDNNTSIDRLLSSAKDDAVISVQKKISGETRGIESMATEKGQIALPPSKKEVIIYSEQYGPLPVTLSVKNPDGKVVTSVVNENSDKTLFRVPAALLQNDSKIEISNAFGDKLVDKKVSVTLYSKMEEHGQIFYEKNKDTIVDILYGTDRKRNPKKVKWEKYYTGERGKLKYGVAQVSIPKTHVLGKMERPKHWWQRETIGKHVMITKLEDIDKKEFLEFLKRKLAYVKERDILIFIHGFNVTFASAIRRTAQISYDLKFKGVPMAYSWPSRGKVSEYMYDEASVQYAVPHLVAFLKSVIDKRGDANIHIIAHSMGTRLLTNALKEISFVYPEKHVFKNIILAAPDIDSDVFKESLFPYVRKTTDKITLYASSDDKALQASGALHGGTRIGQSGDNIFVFEGLDTIDASGIDTSMLGHSYFAEKDILIKDLKEVVHKSLPPKKRDTLIEQIKARLEYWKFRLNNQNRQ